ncbi:hypothetical protein SLS62_005104 [Diatrype stigma]|uniref:Uncharacterized protein n=1 Tax=Diatrype stigma TaxID=117547 RepID=A0AAN9YT52_9PEZI
MIPPIDEEILKNNPDFERVYKKVTGALLNPDASTKDDAVAKKREAVQQELREHRLKATRRYILRHAIKTAALHSSSPEPTSTTAAAGPTTTSASGRPQLPHRRTRSSSAFSTTTTTTSSQQQQQPPPPPLPQELIDILLLLPPLLDSARDLPPSSLALLLTTPPLSHLPTHFPHLLAHLSTTLTATATALARIAHPQTNTSYLHRTIPSLPSTTRALVTQLATTRQVTLRGARLRAATALSHATLDGGAREVLAQLLRRLETKHGPAARSTALRAERAALDAQAWNLAAQALRWDATATWYSPEARAALANYRRHLGGARMRMADAVRVREAELAEFGVRVGEGDDGDGNGDGGDGDADGDADADMSHKEKTLREIARVYREMEGRMAEVQADLERLGMS